MCKKTITILVLGIIFVCGFQGKVEAYDGITSQSCDKNNSYGYIILGKCPFDALDVKKMTEDMWTYPYRNGMNIAISRETLGTFSQACKNVSGVDIDVARNDRLYEEYEKCIKDLVDPKQFARDAKLILEDIGSTFQQKISYSDQQNSAYRTTFKKYCPIASNIVKCEDKLQPIYTECFSPYFNTDTRFRNTFYSSSFDFLCGNDAENATKFFDEKLLDCIPVDRNNTDLYECLLPGLEIILESEADIFCKIIENFKNCFVQHAKCSGPFAASALTHIKTNICDNFSLNK